jgi:hypothetical protein
MGLGVAFGVVRDCRWWSAGSLSPLLCVEEAGPGISKRGLVTERDSAFGAQRRAGVSPVPGLQPWPLSYPALTRWAITLPPLSGLRLPFCRGVLRSDRRSWRRAAMTPVVCTLPLRTGLGSPAAIGSLPLFAIRWVDGDPLGCLDPLSIPFVFDVSAGFISSQPPTRTCPPCQNWPRQLFPAFDRRRSRRAAL